MRFPNLAAHVSVVALLLCAASTAESQVVTFSKIDDAVPSRFFNPATTAPAVGSANKLVIGLHTNFDSSRMKYAHFRASTATYSYPTAMDTISFVATAPPGFYISKITYTQQGTGSVVRSGKAAGAANWVVAGVASDLATFGTSPAFSRTVDLTGKRLTVVPVSISNTLFANAPPSLGSATITVTGAYVVVQLLPL